MSNIMYQALQAMMTGQSPQQFMQNLASQNSMLQGMDFSNMEQTARNIAKMKGVDPDSAVNEIKNNIPI